MEPISYGNPAGRFVAQLERFNNNCFTFLRQSTFQLLLEVFIGVFGVVDFADNVNIWSSEPLFVLVIKIIHQLIKYTHIYVSGSP